MNWLLSVALGSIGGYLALCGHWIQGAVVIYAAWDRLRH